MNSFFTIIKLDYLQRTRSYNFLITLCASLAIAYTFIPEPNANYSTIRISNYVGFYNSSWFGYVTAIMSSIFLSLIGFYLINSGIKRDIDTKVGQIIATTKTSNFRYLFAKVLSNYLILLTILLIIFFMSIVLFFLYNDGFPFEPLNFIKPYLLIPIPAMFLISVLAVIFEVFLGKYNTIMNITFFFLFSFLMIFQAKTEIQYSLDIFGNKIVIHHLEETVRNIKQLDNNIDMNIGYVLGNVQKSNKFEFNGMEFSTLFIISRFLWIFIGFIAIISVSSFFHRFNLKERKESTKKDKITLHQTGINNIQLFNLPKAKNNYSVIPLIKTEFLLLFRKGKRWLWLINLIGILVLFLTPLKIAHQIVLPILWFFQVNRISDLTTKENTNNIHYFTFSSFKPLRRIFFSQIIAAIFLMIFLASPLLIRFAFNGNIIAIGNIISGGVFIIALASTLGLITKGKKLFEVLFFMVTYMNINKIPFTDYFGGTNHTVIYFITLLVSSIFLWSLSYYLKKRVLQSL